MKPSILCAVLLSASLSACGGGGSSVDMSSQAAAIDQSMGNIAQQYPQAPAFKGAYVTVEGVAAGWYDGTSELGIVKTIADTVVSNPVKFQPLYKLLVGQGLHVTILGSITANAYGGLTTHDDKYVATLTASGVVITQEG